MASAIFLVVPASLTKERGGLPPYYVPVLSSGFRVDLMRSVQKERSSELPIEAFGEQGASKKLSSRFECACPCPRFAAGLGGSNDKRRRRRLFHARLLCHFCRGRVGHIGASVQQPSCLGVRVAG